MATPERAFWPFTPRPAVLPLPEPGPRPTRMRFLVEPGLGDSSLCLVILPSPRSLRRALSPTRLGYVLSSPCRGEAARRAEGGNRGAAPLLHYLDHVRE